MPYSHHAMALVNRGTPMSLPTMTITAGVSSAVQY